MTANWYREHHATGDAPTVHQLERYLESARAAGCGWIA
jgi:CDP-glucose 4,6-dehydratase